ncbi:HAD family hydrolase [Pontibacter diazotrophicus]|uniref:phosphoglycolate phosphatase n=1 Tax=Pontibacter diazotrophicus TaxID=1400979 RepID=A0A3D8LGW6_9BACT|nr:HAD family hydrolase [Pontibacter diazotrophicus]RDV16699.1 HAD family hydrolase [Pontibacter diazotrophicus]
MQHEQTSGLDWGGVKAVIFDVDGTLYDQSKLRKKMLFALLNYYTWRPWRIKEMMMLSHFRDERERRAGHGCLDLEHAQYVWCAEKKGYSVNEIREVVERWIFQHPIRYLAGCMYPGTQELFNMLRQHNIKIAIYSDYKAHDKLNAMGLAADLVVSSTDPEVNQLKPDPKGLLYVVDQLGFAPADCLFIGDRQEMDGECALRANMPYLIIDKKPFRQFDFFANLTHTLTYNSLEHGTQYSTH